MPKIDYPNDIKIIKRKNKFYIFARVFLVLIMLSVVSILLVQNTNLKNLPVFSFMFSGERENTIEEYTVYAVILGRYNNLDDAQTVATASSLSGASGFVWTLENEYVVIANIYKSSEQAQSVKENLSSSPYSVEILAFIFDKIEIKIDTLDDEQKKLICEILKHLESLFGELSTNVIQVEKGEISNIACASFVNAYKSEVTVYISKLDYLLAKSNNTTIMQVKSALLIVSGQLENMVNKSLSDKDIKYEFANYTYTIYNLNKELNSQE